MKRTDDFSTRREHLAGLSDDELKARFWQLAEKIVNPLVKLGYENTSPAIERSVLLRMGFSSLEAKPIVDGLFERGLLGHGAGNIVYKLSLKHGVSVREAGLGLIENANWDEVLEMFRGDSK